MCYLCADNGFVCYRKVQDGASYEYLLYCDECEFGNDYKYDGKEYKTKPVKEVLRCEEVEKIRAENIFPSTRGSGIPKNVLKFLEEVLGWTQKS